MKSGTRLISLLLFLSVALNTHAQKEKVYLKYGGLLKGTIEYVTRDNISIRIDSVTAVQLKWGSVEGVRTQKRNTIFSLRERQVIDSINRLPREERTYSQLNVGFLYGEDGTYLTALSNLSLDYSLHRQYKDRSSLGLGIGLDYYPAFMNVPIFAEYRREFTHVPGGTFFYGRFGYSLSRARSDFQGFYSSVKGDEMVAFGLGKYWPLGTNRLSLTLGVRRQYLRTSTGGGIFESYTKWQLTRLDFKVGITF